MRTNTGQILYIPKIGQRADFQHPLMKGCIGWWPLTDGGGGIAKDLARGNDGTASGSATFETTSLGVAAEYDGSASFHWLADSFSYTTKLTVSCWMRSDGTGVEQPAFCKGRSNSCTWWLGTNSSNEIRFATKKGGSLFRIDHSVTSIADWHHLVLVQQATNPGIQAFVNGVSVYSGGSTGSLHSNSHIPMIGAATLSTSTPPSSVEDFEGNVANVRIWNRVLSDSEVFQLYTNPWVGLQPLTTSTRYFYFPPRPLSETIGTFKMRNLSFTPKSGGRTIIRKPS